MLERPRPAWEGFIVMAIAVLVAFLIVMLNI
jgi:hypothetical protein